MKAPRIYVAARWVDGAQAVKVARQLAWAGAHYTSTWLEAWCEEEPPLEKGHERIIAHTDLGQIRESNAMLLLVHTGKVPERGGRLVELGTALAAEIPVFVLGAEGCPNIFHSLCAPVGSVGEALSKLKKQSSPKE